MLTFLIDNIFVEFAGQIFQQVIGIPMGTNCAPLLADLFLYSYEAEFIQGLLAKGEKKLAQTFNFSFRYIDDLLSLNNPRFHDFTHLIYPKELELKDTTDTPCSASYLDLFLKYDPNGKLYTRIYDKRDDFNFSIVNFPFLCSNIPASPAYGVYISQLIRYGRACSNYEDFIARGQLLTTRLQHQGYTTPRLKSTFRKFFGRQHDIVGLYEKSASADDLCANCESGCDVSTGDCRAKCTPLHFGERCEKSCDSCDGYCDKITGKCEACKSFKYGENCEQVCSNGCKFGCNRTTGVCNSCKFEYYGPMCDKRCPQQCQSRTCDRTGVCENCQETYWGPRCGKSCSEGCHERKCNHRTGHCIKCKPTYWGNFCESECTVLRCKECQWDEFREKDICQKCFVGYYGENCDKRCSRNCLDRKCYHPSGECKSCKKGWFGKTCKRRCFKNCASCKDSTTCKECEDGFYGIRCEHTCPSGCKRCSREGGKCLLCDNENADPHVSANCMCTKTQCTDVSVCEDCKNMLYLPLAKVCCPCEVRKCADENGQEENCGDRNQTACSGQCLPGYHGSHCSKKCSSHCGGAEHLCDKDTGHCEQSCEDGWHGVRCDVHCNHFLPHCTRCRTSTKLEIDSYHVECIDCERGYYLEALFYEECLRCVNCANGMCNVVSGTCLEGCQKGYFHGRNKHCDMSCKNCIDENCYTNGTCVMPGCKPGFHGSDCSYECPFTCKNKTCDGSGLCDLGCKNGYYGSNCRSKCQNCLNNKCHEKTGKCFECKPRYWGDNCDQPCSGCIEGRCSHPHGCKSGCKAGFYSKFCEKSCLENCPACDQVLGKCSLCADKDDKMCLDKQRMPWSLSLSFPNTGSCEVGMYGPDCDDTCPSGCSTIGGGVSSCDRITGTCLHTGCRNGFYGMYCERNCSNCKLNRNKEVLCERSSGNCTQGCQEGWDGVKCEEKINEDKGLTAWQTILVVVLPVIAVLGVAVLLIIYCKPRSSKDRYVPTTTEEGL